MSTPRAHGQSTSTASNNTNATATAANPEMVYKKMSLEQLMDLDVTSVSKAPQPYGQAPAAIQVITSDEIRRSGAWSLPQALRLADNLDVAQVYSSVWDISARGFNSSTSDKLLVLMDGRSLYTPLFAGEIWNMQDYLLEDIDRIEVISGPGGTLWGANAVNGVINITSKSAKDTQGLYVEGGGGYQLRDFGGVRYGGILATDVYYRVYGKYFDDGPQVFTDGTSANDPWNRGQGGFRIDSERSAQNPLTLQGDFFVGETHVEPGGETNALAQGATYGGNLLGRWSHIFSDENETTLQMYYDRTHLEAPFQSAPTNSGFPPFFPPSPAIPGGTLRDDLDTIDLDFQHRFPLCEWNHVVWGLGYRFTHDVLDNSPTVAFFPAIDDQELFSGFVQDETKILDRIHITVGSKVEHNDYTGFEYEPSARVQLDVADKQMLWGAVSRSVRMPSRYDRDLFQPGPGYLYVYHIEGNSSFVSEDLLAYELGYRAEITPKLSASASAFYNNYDNLRSQAATINPTPTSLIEINFQNGLKGHTVGFELSGDYQLLDWWRLHAGYDFIKEHIHVKAGQTDLEDALGETADPQNQVFLRSSMDLPGRIELDADSRWIDIVHNNDGNSIRGTVPDYWELDVRLGWHATKNLELSVVGQNLLHDHHAEAGFPGPTQEQIVRNVYGEVAFRW